MQLVVPKCFRFASRMQPAIDSEHRDLSIQEGLQTQRLKTKIDRRGVSIVVKSHKQPQMYVSLYLKTELSAALFQEYVVKN